MHSIGFLLKTSDSGRTSIVARAELERKSQPNVPVARVVGAHFSVRLARIAASRRKIPSAHPCSFDAPKTEIPNTSRRPPDAFARTARTTNAVMMYVLVRDMENRFVYRQRKEGIMNFTPDMLARLHPQERLLLQMLYDRVQEEPPPPPEWPWWMPGPATEAQAITARRGVPSPRLKAGTSRVEVPSLEAPASSGDHASQASSPAQHQLTPPG